MGWGMRDLMIVVKGMWRGGCWACRTWPSASVVQHLETCPSRSYLQLYAGHQECRRGNNVCISLVHSQRQFSLGWGRFCCWYGNWWRPYMFLTSSPSLWSEKQTIPYSLFPVGVTFPPRGSQPSLQLWTGALWPHRPQHDFLNCISLSLS